MSRRDDSESRLAGGLYVEDERNGGRRNMGLNKKWVQFAVSVFLVATLGNLCGCRKEEVLNESVVKKTESTDKLAELRFPPELYSKDSGVNEVLREAMAACAAKDYERFRLLWSAQENPIPREAFEESWRAVRWIQIQALEPAYV